MGTCTRCVKILFYQGIRFLERTCQDAGKFKRRSFSGKPGIEETKRGDLYLGECKRNYGRQKIHGHQAVGDSL